MPASGVFKGQTPITMNVQLTNRRSFLKQLTAAGLAAPFVTRGLMAQSPNSVVRHASFGASGMAGADISEITKSKAIEFVAVADADLTRTTGLKKQFPNLKVYQDWRELLDKEAKNLDSVNVSTPDHMHAPIGMSALNLGKAVYGQKPLAHDIYEVRRLTEVARDKKLVTQMGIQIHSDRAYRMGVKLIRDGVIGKVREVHSFCGKSWGDESAKPDRTDPVPEGFNWDLWLGVAAERPFIGGGYYHPGSWRRRLDFGTGTFGDMGCHIFDPVFEAVALTAPLSVRSEGPACNQWNWANDSIIHYVFPGTPYTADKTIRVSWYDGKQRPPAEVTSFLGEGEKLPGIGSIFLGTDGVMVLPHWARPQLFPDAKFKDFVYPKIEVTDHWQQFVNAVAGKGQTSAPFDYSGPLTEAVLLGGVASRLQKTTLEWDAKKLAFTNSKDATALIRRPYRKGWEVAGL